MLPWNIVRSVWFRLLSVQINLEMSPDQSCNVLSRPLSHHIGNWTTRIVVEPNPILIWLYLYSLKLISFERKNFCLPMTLVFKCCANTRKYCLWKIFYRHPQQCVNIISKTFCHVLFLFTRSRSPTTDHSMLYIRIQYLIRSLRSAIYK